MDDLSTSIICFKQFSILPLRPRNHYLAELARSVPTHVEIDVREVVDPINFHGVLVQQRPRHGG